MLTEEEIIILKEKWYTFEEIESIKRWVKSMEEWKTISEKEFWDNVYSKINAKMKEHA